MKTRSQFAAVMLLLLMLSSFDCAAQGVPSMTRLPPNIKRLTWFGERASFSPDDKRIAFMSKSYGDAFEIDLATGAIRCLTCHFRHPGFLRIQFLPNGDYFLIGPPEYKSNKISREIEAEMWVMKADLSGPPTRLNHRIHEGVAISRKAMRIAWANSSGNYPEEIPRGTRIYLADIVYDGGKPKLANKQIVHDEPEPDCFMEPQDFYHNDRELTYSCYQPKGTSDVMSDVMSIDLETRRVTNHTHSPGVYDEVEGIIPGTDYTMVECDNKTGKGAGYIDIWKLKLDGTGRDYVRLTHFNDTPAYKASNPVVSTDGKWMAFQEGHPQDDAGVGYGIFLYRLK